MSEKIKPQHLDRKAILYVRQSSAYQVAHNEESRRLQYAMEQRLRNLGWKEIEIVDDDLGCTARGVVTRNGFERMVSDVCLGKVGAVAAREVSRFARNNREWQQLVEVCRVVDTLLIDQEMAYAPRQSNDRLLLGLKGSLNEYELDLLRQRSLEARYEKARRGELIVSAPVGYVKTEDQRLEKDPDRRVQERISLVFCKFAELGSVRQTLMWFLEENLELPGTNANGIVSWKRPRYSTVMAIVSNPVYGGAYVYGRTEHGQRYENGQSRKTARRRSREEWLSLIPDHHEGYVSWKEFEEIQEAIQNNRPGNDRVGAPKSGAALLSGLVRCRHCSRKLLVTYTGRDRRYPRYACQRGYLDNGESKCISFGGGVVDQAISKEIMRVVAPAAIEASVQIEQNHSQEYDAVLEAIEQDLQAARYVAQHAQKQFDAADPENRLVVDELERRWNDALVRVAELEHRIEQQCHFPTESSPAAVEEFSDLASQLESVWNDENTDTRLKKRIVRTLIREVVAGVDSATGHVELVVHWHGGIHTKLSVLRRRRGMAGSTSSNIVEAVRILSRVSNDATIAGWLNRNGLKTGAGNRWTQERVASLRNRRKIPAHRSRNKDEQGWLTLKQAAALLGISPKTLRLAAERGNIPYEHPLADGPWVFKQSDLESSNARNVVDRAKRRHSNTGLPTTQQQDLGFSGTNSKDAL